MQRTIYTVGHGTGNFACMERHLAPHHVTTVVDVRSSDLIPDSGDFERAEIEDIAAEAGVGYRWLGDRLGPDPGIRPGAVSAGIDEVVGLAATGTVVLMCVEPDPADCHRMRRIAPRLLARGYRVMHIRADGSAGVHQDELEL